MHSSRLEKAVLTCAGLQTTPSQVSQYGAENGNLQKSGSIFRHGTVFALKECIHQKEATGIEGPKMSSSHCCKTAFTCLGLQMSPYHVSQDRAEN